MANDVTIDGEQYRLRASKPIPISTGDFVIHTFMAEKNKIINYLVTDTLPGSDQFRGQGGTDDYISASFSRLPDVAGDKFQGRIVVSPEYIEEDAMQGNPYG